MKTKIVIFTIIAITTASGICLAQSREPSTGSESSSTGVWPSVESGSDVGYDSGNHGNVS